MKTSNPLTLSTSPLSQTARNSHETVSLTRRQRPLYRRKRHYHTGKERDSETGLYYYGARYLDSRTGRWLSGDPAMGEYVPSAPVNDEARKRNQNLPGQGGVFNYVNLHVYHYAGNNPVKYVDPDGRELDMVFVIKEIKKTDYGIRASGDLTITDRDTGKTITVGAYSGGSLNTEDSDGVSLPIPLGEYDILQMVPSNRGYRLEAKDSNYGNDVVEGVSPEQGTLRLHGPGATYGCLAVENWSEVEAYLTETSKSEVKVPSKGLDGRAGALGFKDLQKKYGTLTVRSRAPIHLLFLMQK